MTGSHMTDWSQCSHLKLDDVTTAAHLFVLAMASIGLYTSVYACVPVRRQTDHPQTVGTLLAEEGNKRREGDGCRR